MCGTFGVEGVLELLCLVCYELRHWDWFGLLELRDGVGWGLVFELLELRGWLGVAGIGWLEIAVFGM
jgi:hypothetical protein